jgi:hypothetical protein
MAGGAPAGASATGITGTSSRLSVDVEVEEIEEMADDQPHIPDDLSYSNSISSNTRVPSTELLADEDDDDLFEIFVADCVNPASWQQQHGHVPAVSTTPVTSPSSCLPPHTAQLDPVVAVGLDSGDPFTVEPNFMKARHCFTNKDRSRMKLYDVCDKAGCPRYLMDKVLAQLKVEMSVNNFDPLDPTITKRNAFMAKMHRKFPSPPPVAIQVTLESFAEPVTIYRFDAVKQLQAHLLRHDLYGDLQKLNVNPENPWDQSLPSRPTHMREVTDSQWFKDNVAAANAASSLPSDLDEGTAPSQYINFLLPIDTYEDATHNDEKESSGLEPVMAGSCLLSSEFNSDSSARSILGYMPSFTTKKAAPGKKKKKFGAGVRDYHKCMSIILEPLVEAMREPPIVDVLLGNQIRRVRLIIVMAIALSDGKSSDMLCGRVMSQSNCLRLSRATFTPSDSAADTTDDHVWIKSNVIEIVTRAALYDVLARDEDTEWNLFLANTLTSQTNRVRHVSAAKRRVRICKEILKKALGSHAVRNAFFPIFFGSEYGIFGHTFADIMHVLEEGIMKYLLAVFLDPLSATVSGDLDDLVTKLLGPKANRCHGMRLFPRVNFTRGFSRLTLLSSEERVGELLALVIVLQTDEGKHVLRDRFAPGFDDLRKATAARFSGSNAQQEVGVELGEGEAIGEEADEELMDVVDDDNQDLSSVKRTAEFVPTRASIRRVCSMIRLHDLGFLFTDVFPNIPDRHILECLKIIWKMTFRLGDNYNVTIPLGSIDIEPFRKREPCRSATLDYSYSRLISTFVSGAEPQEPEVVHLPAPNQQPSITHDPQDFVNCCEKLLSLRSFYHYASEYCPEVIPLKPEDGSFNEEFVQARTKEVADSLKATVNRGVGTNGWRIPKFIDMLHLPRYMARLAATGRFHVGFAECNLKDWAKRVAKTAQKRGGGVFEGQCAARIQERSMIQNAITQMESDEESLEEDEEEAPPETDDAGVGGSRYHIKITRDVAPNQQRKTVQCTRLYSSGGIHHLQDDLPSPLINHFKTIGRYDETFELRTEAMINGTRYRSHPNYLGKGPWHDYVNVHWELDTAPPDYSVFVNDYNQYPAKIAAFFRRLPDTEFTVLAHCAEFQRLNSDVYARRTLLTRSWLYEVTDGVNPRPRYNTIGTVKQNIQIKGHILAVEEQPGFHNRYPTETERRFIVVGDMRREWPSTFMEPMTG